MEILAESLSGIKLAPGDHIEVKTEVTVSFGEDERPMYLRVDANREINAPILRVACPLASSCHRLRTASSGDVCLHDAHSDQGGDQNFFVWGRGGP